ncbi:MAG: ubiquinol oxidase subunit II [Simkaniaceae bacterium]
MKKAFKITFLALIVVGVIALAGLYISTHQIPVLNPSGMIAVKEKDLIVTASLLMLIVCVPVFIFALVFSIRYKEGTGKGKHTPDWEHNYIAEYFWWGVPFIIIVILAVLTWKSSHQLNPFKPIENGKKPLTIQVVALEWKWLFLYPEQGIATVNYIKFPEKTPIAFEITADAPMNSFWIPALGGMIYAMPTMRSKLHLIADKTGSFRGLSSNFSGEGFAGMKFEAVSTTEEDFAQWVSQVRSSGKNLGMAQYEQLAKPSQYDPVSVYNLVDLDLFDQILEKYLVPGKGK